MGKQMTLPLDDFLAQVKRCPVPEEASAQSAKDVDGALCELMITLVRDLYGPDSSTQSNCRRMTTNLDIVIAELESFKYRLTLLNLDAPSRGPLRD